MSYLGITVVKVGWFGLGILGFREEGRFKALAKSKVQSPKKDRAGIGGEAGGEGSPVLLVEM